MYRTIVRIVPAEAHRNGFGAIGRSHRDDFHISTTIAGVNMRLGPGGVRELHWHQQAEWTVVTYGNCRVTILDQDGRPQVADVKEGDLWYFPAGLPHSLQGLDPDGTEFVLAFDNGVALLLDRTRPKPITS